MITLYVDDKAKLPEPVKVTENGTEEHCALWAINGVDLLAAKFGANAQPFYVLLDNEGKPLNKSYSYDEDIQKYIDFLENRLKEP